MPLAAPPPDALPIMIRTATSTHIFLVEPGDAIDISQPIPGAISAVLMVTLRVDASGVQVEVHSPDDA